MNLVPETSVAARPIPGTGPVAEEGPASVPFPRGGAGHLNLTQNDLMDAARATQKFAEQMHPRLRLHWDALTTRLEEAAVAAGN